MVLQGLKIIMLGISKVVEFHTFLLSTILLAQTNNGILGPDKSTNKWQYMGISVDTKRV